MSTATLTTADPIGLMLSRLEGVKSAGEGKWTALCPEPGHDDHVASLSIKVCPDGTVLLKCHRGCNTQAVLAAVDLDMKDLFPKGTSPNGDRSIDATYDYRDTFGVPLFQVVRFRPKGFAQRRPDSAGGWLWNLKGISPVLYKLQELTKAHSDRWVLMPEGEKHVDRLDELDFVSTTSPMGAGKWRNAYAESLKDRRVAILPDNDAVGRRHAEQVAASLAGKAREVRIVELPGLGEHGDILDWIAGGGNRDQLIALVQAAPAWQPPSSDEPATAHAGDRVPFDLSDDGNALRFAARYADRVRFVHGPDRWMLWDGCRWASDDGGQVVEFGREMVRAIADEAADAPTPTRADQLMSWAGKSHEEPRIRRTLILARSDPRLAVTPDQLDSDPWMLNALNGTIDLRTGDLRHHDPADLITKLAPVEFDPEAYLPLWNRLLDDATGGYGSDGDPETIGFLQRAAGYSATGDAREEVLLFVHGQTCSCKSTFIEAIKAALGDYAVTADFEAFLDRRQVGGARNDIARLAGARLVSSIEVDEGSRLAAGLLKTLVGGDTVTARYLYAEAFEFAPSFTLWLVANHTPRVNPEDGAMWRRILLVPFPHTVPLDMVDPKVKLALTDPKVAGPAVLAWIVRGCLLWREDGLQVPESVRAATAAYRRDQDPLADFVDECLVFSPDLETGTSDVRGAYLAWCDREGFGKPVGVKRVAEKLRALGAVDDRDMVRRFWRGVGLTRAGHDLEEQRRHAAEKRGGLFR